MRYKSLLFDLDGTVTDSSEGIINSIIYAMNKMNYKIEDKSVLKKFIGPPLMDSYKKYFGFSDEEAELGLQIYREYFTEKGMYENRLYDGMEQLLKDLSAAGYDLILATSKPEEHARIILDYFGISQYFSYAAGCPMDENGFTKVDVIKYAMKHAKAKEKSRIVMIGDTQFDILGAAECRIDSIAVLYGMGEPEELKDATYTANNIEELRKILL